jgi:hypothetical protein
MSAAADIKKAVQTLAGTYNQDFVTLILCKVISVDIPKRTAQVGELNWGGNMPVFDAKLMAANGNGFLIVPKVGSEVSVLLSNKNTPFICQYSDIDIMCLNGKDKGGVPIVESLVDRLNKIENRFNNFLTSSYNTHTHLVTYVNSPTAVPNALDTSTLTPTVKSDIENTKVLHGTGANG